jgi:serine/threonine protein kinase
MSPEQARAEPLDHRTDLYSTGIVLYMLLTGRDPFHHHQGMIALLHAHTDELPVAPSAIAPQPIPDALDRAVLRALSKSPDDRFDSAEEFSAELARVMDGGLPMRWAATEPLDVSMFRAHPASRIPRIALTSWAPQRAAFSRSGADDPTCVEAAQTSAIESVASGHTYLDMFRKSERPTLGFIGASVLAALFAVGLIGAALWSSLGSSFR